MAFLGRDSKPSKQPNKLRIDSSTYVVRTQAGFRSALKDFVASQSGDKDYQSKLKGHPTAYPALVVFHDGYYGQHYPVAICYPVNFLANILSEV